MHRSSKVMVVGRDRAHVRSLLAAHPAQEVVSASQFFDYVRLLAFIHHGDLRRDDYAPIIIAQGVLAQRTDYLMPQARNFSSLYAACAHGLARPHDVLAALAPEHEKYRAIFSIVHEMDQAMSARGLVTGVSALLLAYDIIKERQVLPPHLAALDQVSLHHLVDLTMLEIEVIKELSKQGLNFDIRLPLDFNKRGINKAVDFAAALFEKDSDVENIDLAFDKLASSGPLSPLIDNLFTDENIDLPGQVCTITTAPSLLREADLVAEKILELCFASSSSASAPSIALVMRTMDARANIFKQSLLRHNINVRDRKGIALNKTNAAMLLSTLLAVRQWGQQKIDLVGLIAHPAFIHHVSDGEQRSRVLKLVDKLGLDNRIITHQHSLQHYRTRIERFLETSADHAEDLAALMSFVSKVDEMVAPLADKSTVKDFVQAVILLLSTSIKPEEPSLEPLTSALEIISTSAAFSDNDPLLALKDLIAWLKSELATLTVPRPDNLDHGAVEFLLMPEMLGRHFDHVFIADMAFGRLPHVSMPDALLDDRDRLILNGLMKKPLLRVFLDDPFEPMPTPPRQALEPFWFAHGILAAQKSIHFSTAERDEKDQEQSPSEFFAWLVEHVTLTQENKTAALAIKNKQYQRLMTGVFDQSLPATSPQHQALHARARGFSSAQVSEYFFAVEKKNIHSAFMGRLSTPPTKALSPTMIEAFSECHLRGFLQRILNWDYRAHDADDIDARAIGEIAHSALEQYFDGDWGEVFHISDVQKRLRVILDQVMKDFVANAFVGFPKLLLCHEEWLFDALTTLIVHLDAARRERNATTVMREIDLGLKGARMQPLPLSAGAETYLVGGRIDRVDQNADGFLIIDYKLSTSDALRGRLNPKKILTGNFQAAIYARLVARHLAKDDRQAISFAFASIRDGEILPPLSYQGNEEVFDKIFDDEAPGSLAQGIDEIFSPIKRGAILARTGDHCAHCDFASFCRRGEAAHDGC